MSEFLGKAEVSNLGVAILEEKNILRFEISEQYSLVVQLLKSKDDTSKQEPQSFLSCLLEHRLPFASLLDEGVAISSFRPLHCYIVVFIVTEGAVKLRDERGP